MDEQPQDVGSGDDRPRAEGDRSRREPAAAPGTPARTEVPSATRRRLLVGVGAVLVGAAVPTGIVAFGGGSGGRGSGSAKKAAKGGRLGSSAAPPLLRTPPPIAIPAHPTLRALGTLKGRHRTIDGFRFSPDGTTLATSEPQSGVLRIWDVAGRTERVASLRSSNVRFTALAFSPDGRTLATGSDERAQFWDTATLRPQGIEITKAGDDSVQEFSAVAFSPDGRSFVASGFNDDEIRFYNPVTRRPDGGPLQGDASANIMVFSPDGRMLASVDESGSDGVQIWDVAARTRRAKPSLNVFGGAQNLVFSPDGATLAIDNDSNEVRFVAAATGKEQGPPLRGHIGSVTGLAFSTDGHTVVTSDYSGLHFWDAATHKKRATATIPGTPPTVKKPGGGVTITNPGTRTIHQFALSPDGRTVATAGFQAKTVAFWRLE
ncbi:MAG: WD40 repeat domain-containing protein [Actinoallomurus sp.]